MKRLFVPISALAATLAFSIPAAAFMFAGASPPAAIAGVRPANPVALSPDGKPVRVIHIPDRRPEPRVIADIAVPASFDVASATAEIKEAAIARPAPARSRRQAEARHRGGRAAASPRALEVGFLY